MINKITIKSIIKSNILIIAIFIFSISCSSNKISRQANEFSYPKSKDATIIMASDKFEDFKEEWRGDDYYYICEEGDRGIICSILFYKLNKQEQIRMVDPYGDATSPSIPLLYFSSNSNLKNYESNKQSWGEMTEDFMFRQADIVEFDGKKVNQKNMFAYCMFGKDLFVNIHLSKVNCTAEDSTAMRQILAGLKKKK